jgi:putative oxidoreductase
MSLRRLMFPPTSVDSRLDAALLVLRLVAGLAFMFHGWGKIQNPFGWMGDKAPGILQALAALSEFGGGFCWMLGGLTRLSSAGLLCTMVVAAGTHISKGDPFVGKGGSYELALVYLAISLLLLLVGPGRFSLDHQLAEPKA